MQHECKITVIDKKCFTDYQEQYLADPKSGPCPFFNVGDEFILRIHSEAYAAAGRFLSFDERQVLRRGMGCHQPVCLHCPSGRLYHERLDK